MGAESCPQALDAHIGRLAERQHGVVARRQLLEAGLSRRAIGHRLQQHRLLALHRGVYAVGHRVLTAEGRWMAAVLAAGPGAVLSHRAAGAHWGMRPWSGAVEVTVPRRGLARRGIRIHCSPVPGDERTVVRGIPITTVPRTLLDLAAVLDRHELERAIREAEVLRLYDELSLEDLVARHPGRRGSRRLVALLDDHRLDRGITRSVLEDRFLALLDENRLPRPAVNSIVEVRDASFEVDCAWPAQRLIVELDGRATHATRHAFERDRERDRILQAAGWRVVRLTWRQLDRDAKRVVADLRQFLASKSSAPP